LPWVFKKCGDLTIETAYEIGYNFHGAGGSTAQKETQMANDKFSTREALNYGWETFKANIPFFLGFMVVVSVLTFVPRLVIERLFEPQTALYFVVNLIVSLISIFAGMMALRISLYINDDGSPELSRLSETFSYFPYYLGGELLRGLIVGGVYIVLSALREKLPVSLLALGELLWLPFAIVFTYMFFFTGYLIIDKGLGPIEALKESRALTYGYKKDLLVFSLVMGLINAPGLFFIFVGTILEVGGMPSGSIFTTIGKILMVGLIVSIPVSLMALTQLYRRFCPVEAASQTA